MSIAISSERCMLGLKMVDVMVAIVNCCRSCEVLFSREVVLIHEILVLAVAELG